MSRTRTSRRDSDLQRQPTCEVSSRYTSDNRGSIHFVREVRRRGGILVIVIIALLVVSMVGTALVQTAAFQQRESLESEQRQQIRWLAESAFRRAAHQLNGSADYRGELWQIPSGALEFSDAFAVQIDVVPVDADPTRRTMRVAVIMTVEGASRVKFQDERTFVPPAEPSQPM